jgi:hypothetical protein
MSVIEDHEVLEAPQTLPGVYAVAGIVTGLVASVLWLIFLGWVAAQLAGWIQHALLPSG